MTAGQEAAAWSHPPKVSGGGRHTMRAAVVGGPGDMRVLERPVPEVTEGSVLCRVLVCGVCGSDLRILEQGSHRVTYPATLGHEMAAEVVEVGRGVEGIRVGDRITVGADVPCGACEWCRRDAGNCCETNYAVGYQFPGGYAEYCLLDPLLVAHGSIRAFTDAVDPEHAALSEPLACCINGLERGRFAPGHSVVVLGAGPMGAMLAALARGSGASLTILCDVDPARLELARCARADESVDASRGDLIARIMVLTNGRGADLVLIACADPGAQEAGVTLAARRGCVVFFGGLANRERAITLSANVIHYREVSIAGAHGSTPRQHALALDMIAGQRIDLGQMITHRFPLDRIEQAFETVRRRTGLKVMVNP